MVGTERSRLVLVGAVDRSCLASFGSWWSDSSTVWAGVEGTSGGSDRHLHQGQTMITAVSRLPRGPSSGKAPCMSRAGRGLCYVTGSKLNNYELVQPASRNSAGCGPRKTADLRLRAGAGAGAPPAGGPGSRHGEGDGTSAPLQTTQAFLSHAA